MAGKPRILWLGHFAPYPPKGGAMQRAFNMLKEAANFADIDLVALLPRSKVTSYYEDYEAGTRAIESGLKPYCNNIYLVPHGLGTRKSNKYFYGVLSLFSGKPYDELVLVSRQFKEVSDRLLKENHYDLIYIDTIGLYRLVSHGDIPRILNHHNIESAMLERRASNSTGMLAKYLYWQARKTAKLEGRVCAEASLNLVCSSMDQEKLHNVVRCDTAVIPNGVDASYFSRKSPYKSAEVSGCIFAGGLDWYPNAKAVDFIVGKLLPELEKNESEGLPITICGKGRHNGLIKAAGVSNFIIAAGFVDDIRVNLESAALYVCPISDGGGTKLKVLDALAMGVPLIAHPIACEGINVTPGKDVIFAETPEEYADAIADLMSNPNLREAMSNAGQELIKKEYTYAAIGKEMQRCFLSHAYPGSDQ